MHAIDFSFRAFFCCVICTWIGVSTYHVRASSRPNVIYILADDLGYGDLGCYGSKLNSTPNIDAMASSGLRLTDFHAASWCAPSRRALMTGCHANRPWGKNWQRLATAITIPELLKQEGYSTAIIGKWHLGLEKGLHPLDQGFDYWFGTRGSNDWDGPQPNYDSFRNAPEESWKTPLFINRENKGPTIPQSEFTRRYTEEAIRLIRANQRTKHPFFIYLAHNMPHVPIFASKQFQGKSKNGIYGDVIEEIDWSVGQIIDALNTTKQLENTIVVFTSDNGPWSMFREFGGKSDPLRGEKSTTWEGGERVPCIISWPNQFDAGVCNGWMVNYDMYATIAKFAGAKVPEGHAIDSLDLSDTLLSGAASPRMRHVYFHQRPMAIRRGRYKLHLFTRERTRDPDSGKGEIPVRREPPLLFDLHKDISETHDIAAQHPQLVEQLETEFHQALEAIENWTQF